jgi:hypothetical protein
VLPVGATVKLQMRAVESQTLKVDTGAVIDDAPNGLVHYNWAAADVDTAGYFVAWWRVTISGQYEDTPEFLVWFDEHAPETSEYVSAAELKDAINMSDTTFPDPVIQRAIRSASKTIDDLCWDAPFVAGTPGETRVYTAVSEDWLRIDPMISLTSITAAGTALVAGTNYAIIDGVVRSLNGYRFPRGTVNGVSVVGTFGWAAVPDEIVSATIILATRIMRRVREAPFGIIGFNFEGAAVRISANDSDLDALLGPHVLDMAAL